MRLSKRSRDQRCPVTEIEDITKNIYGWYFARLPDDDEITEMEMLYSVADVYYEIGLEQEETFREKLNDLIAEEMKKLKDINAPGYENLPFAVDAIVLILQARKYLMEGEFNKSWSFISDARFISGALFGTDLAHGNSIRFNAKRASDISHKYNRQREKEFFRWYDKNKHRFNSKNQAAQAASEIFNLSPKTLRKKLTGI
jgi:hypothetical protein